jgi:hypothetical protein
MTAGIMMADYMMVSLMFSLPSLMPDTMTPLDKTATTIKPPPTIITNLPRPIAV